MKTVMLLTIVQLICSFSYGFILPLETVLTKSVALNGNQIFSIEQDVIFKSGSEDFVIRENWLIEGDKNLKMTATGQGALKDLFRMTTVYNSKTKTMMTGKNKVSEYVTPDFFERYLSIRSTDSFKKYLTELTIVPSIRLSRAAGSVAFAIGEPSPVNLPHPQLWIDQELFEIRKLRLPSSAEITLDDYEVNKLIHYPRTKKISWAGHEIVIRVRQISTKTKASLAAFYPQNLDQPSEVNLASKGEVGLFIQDFYKRFR